MSNLHSIDDNVIGRKDTTMNEARARRLLATVLESGNALEELVDVLVNEETERASKLRKPWPDKHRRWKREGTGEGDMQGIMTMDGKIIATGLCYPDAQYIVEAHNAALDHDADPKKPSILEEEWEYEGRTENDRTILGEDEFIFKKGSSLPAETQLWLREMSALPDCLRALVMVWDARGGMETHPDGSRVRLLITQGEWDAIEAALKKAGIE